MKNQLIWCKCCFLSQASVWYRSESNEIGYEWTVLRVYGSMWGISHSRARAKRIILSRDPFTTIRQWLWVCRSNSEGKGVREVCDQGFSLCLWKLYGEKWTQWIRWDQGKNSLKSGSREYFPWRPRKGLAQSKMVRWREMLNHKSWSWGTSFESGDCSSRAQPLWSVMHREDEVWQRFPPSKNNHEGSGAH